MSCYLFFVFLQTLLVSLDSLLFFSSCPADGTFLGLKRLQHLLTDSLLPAVWCGFTARLTAYCYFFSLLCSYLLSLFCCSLSHSLNHTHTMHVCALSSWYVVVYHNKETSFLRKGLREQDKKLLNLEILHQRADNETTLVALLLSDQSTDCSVCSSTFKSQISVLGTSTEGSKRV